MPRRSDANVLEDATRSVMRPDLDLQQALIVLMDARTVLLQIQKVAVTPKGSRERREINSFLPGMAKRLRKVGEAVPIVAAVVSGKEKEETISVKYGGSAGAQGSTMVDEVYTAVGSILTLSGRAVRPELIQTSDPRIETAIQSISQVLDQVSTAEIETAQKTRVNRK